VTSALSSRDPSSWAVAPAQSTLTFSSQGSSVGRSTIQAASPSFSAHDSKSKGGHGGMLASRPVTSWKGKAPSSEKGSCAEREKVKAQSGGLQPVTASKRSCCQLGLALKCHLPLRENTSLPGSCRSSQRRGCAFVFLLMEEKDLEKNPPCDKHVQATEMPPQTSPCPSRRRFPGCIIPASCTLVPAAERALLRPGPSPRAGSRACTQQFARSWAGCEAARGL